jgi:uncharacterized tellurite resistance protein B-like protein
MFDSIMKLIAGEGDGGEHPERYDENDYRLAAAALLMHAATIDGSVSRVERDKLHAVIMQRFNLDDAAANALIEKATEVEREAIDLYKFTANLNRTLDHRGRARIVEMLWQIVCADGVITEFEDNLIWRAADLLGISRNERIALREQVMASRAGGSGTKQ